MDISRHETDVLIIGSGGAGLFAALHAHQANPSLRISVAVKGLLGKCGCTRMVQGGYNVAIADGDSVERHFMDSIVGGKWLPNQRLAWRLVETAVERIHELENEIGCFFDRNADGSMHQKAFAGQSFDRTVHKGDLTGIEIINRLSEQIWALPIERMEEHRALSFIKTPSGDAIAGVLFVDMRTGEFRFVRAKAVLLAAGGGPTMYRYHTPSGDKTCDGMAMSLAAGLELRDMEMVQFHPTGLLAGYDTRMTGTVLEEGLRGAGGYLLNGAGDRFMFDYHEHGERATRDIVSRAINSEMRKGNTTPHGGVYIEMAHLGPEKVARQFNGMVKRCADCGFDLAAGRVEVVPTAHYMMGGVVFEEDCTTTLPGLFVAGEDSGGVHGANRLGGNGVANSTVFGGIAGEQMAAFVANEALRDADEDALQAACNDALAPFSKPSGDLNVLRDNLLNMMWDKVGISREATTLAEALSDLDGLEEELDRVGLPDQGRVFNLTWHDWMNLKNQIIISKSITHAALARENSRGAHFREDFPDAGNLDESEYTVVGQTDDGIQTVTTRPVEFDIVKPGESLIEGEAGAPPPTAGPTAGGAAKADQKEASS
jgi:fumarate reductase flavoprotein subunit